MSTLFPMSAILLHSFLQDVQSFLLVLDFPFKFLYHGLELIGKFLLPFISVDFRKPVELTKKSAAFEARTQLSGVDIFANALIPRKVTVPAMNPPTEIVAVGLEVLALVDLHLLVFLSLLGHNFTSRQSLPCPRDIPCPLRFGDTM